MLLRASFGCGAPTWFTIRCTSAASPHGRSLRLRGMRLAGIGRFFLRGFFARVFEQETERFVVANGPRDPRQAAVALQLFAYRRDRLALLPRDALYLLIHLVLRRID